MNTERLQNSAKFHKTPAFIIKNIVATQFHGNYGFGNETYASACDGIF